MSITLGYVECLDGAPSTGTVSFKYTASPDAPSTTTSSDLSGLASHTYNHDPSPTIKPLVCKNRLCRLYLAETDRPGQCVCGQTRRPA